MDNSMLEIIREKIKQSRENGLLSPSDYRKGHALYVNGACQILSQGKDIFEVLLNDAKEDQVISITVSSEGILSFKLNGKITEWGYLSLASLLQLSEEMDRTEPKLPIESKKYTREGMMKRVLEERMEKAAKANYRIDFADNIYGEHTLITEDNTKYKITLRDFENETGYINNPDLQTNKLGTTKHLIYAYNTLKGDPVLMDQLDKTYPFVEIFLDPLNEYQVTWHYPHPLRNGVNALLKEHFNDKKYLEEVKLKDFLSFMDDAAAFPEIKIRPEVEEKVKQAFDQFALEEVRGSYEIDTSLLKVPLFPYQKKGVEFATFRQGSIIADEMGLGKTIQAIGAAVMKKQIFGFKKSLIVCPASLKEQWKQEIEKFCHEEAAIAEGSPEQRAEVYRSSNAFFIIVNYETVLRDLHEINRMDADLVILDEAQRIKNYTTITAHTIKQIKRRHALIITGTPIENRLIDLYSVVHFVDPHFLAPLWEFSYQHCYFDVENKNKITGYYNLQELNERLKTILIRREKRTVLKDLPNLTEVMVPVEMHKDQQMYHMDYAQGISFILRKKFITPFDQQKLMLLLNNMRMVCDCTFLVDKETYISPKLKELKNILLDKLDIHNSDSKIIIFSEWVTMLSLIGKMLREEGIGFAQLSGKVAVKNRGKLVRKFESDPDCKVFLSSEAGGAGLNLQMADTVINFELPWNPAKKNQRIGRIDRLGQTSKKLTVINLVTKQSIETKIASGLTLKQNLFDGVLNEGSMMDTVDFSASGRAHFLRQLEDMMEELTLIGSSGEEMKDLASLDDREEGVLDELLEDKEEAPVPDPSYSIGGQGSDQDRTEVMEQVMNQGMAFLSGLYKMSTGKEADFANSKVEVDKETGEVVMRFKMPKLQ